MTEQTEGAAPAEATTPESAPAPELIAGKFNDQPAFESGLKNIMSNLGVPAPDGGVPLIGDNGMYSNLDSAVAAYKQYEKLQGKVGGQKEEAPKPQPEAAKPDAKPNEDGSLRIEQKPVTDTDAKSVLDRLGLDPNEIAESWKETGKLSDEHYAKFKEAGFDKEIVDDYIKGKAAEAELVTLRMQQVRNEALGVAGGEESFNTMAQWAASSLSQDELAWFNAQVDGPNVTAAGAKSAVEWLANKYAAGTGTAGSKPTINGQPGANAQGGFSTTNEYYEAVEQIRRMAERGEDTTALARRIAQTSPEVAYRGY